jgi:ABC-type multidrug transport system ATPase subunit
MTWGVDRITVKAGGQTALSGVSLSIGPGETVAVVGGDGAGKTTLCRVLARLIGVDSGVVTLPPRRRVGYQPAGSGTWPDMTVRENLEFVARANDLAAEQRSARVAELMAATNLALAADRLSARLSGGMRQKLGVAMALVPSPDLMILDEPTTGVDPVSRAELWGLISRTAAAGTAFVISTTYLDEAERGQRLLVLDEGSPIGDGTPAQIMEALPGRIWASAVEPPGRFHWRRGRAWRTWTEDGSRPPHVEPLEPDLGDVITAMSLAKEGGRAR